MSRVTSAPDVAVRVASPPALRGMLAVPGDKSISHRAALFNALADGVARVRGLADGADCRSTLACLQTLGVHLERTGDTNGPELRIAGRGLRGLLEPERVLDAGNSGTTTRLLLGILAGQPIFAVLDGDASLRRRPMLRVVRPLRAMGAAILGRADGDRLPLAIQGGRLRGLEHRLPVASAQVKSALLLAGLYADGPTTVIEPAHSRDHSERLLAAQGARIERNGTAVTIWPSERLAPVDVAVPGDFSSAAYWLTLACIHPDARVTVRNVGLNPTRTGLLDVLRTMGGRIAVENERLIGGEPVGDVTAESSNLRGIEIGGDIIPRLIDEVPLVAVAALFSQGTTRIRDAAELRVKESDRLATTASELARLGGAVRELADGLEIRGSAPLHSAVVASHGDHRLAMALAVAGLAGPGAEIQDPRCVDISYPAFWEDARRLGGEVG